MKDYLAIKLIRDVSMFCLACLIASHTVFRAEAMELAMLVRNFSASQIQGGSSASMAFRALTIATNILPRPKLREIDRTPGAVGTLTTPVPLEYSPSPQDRFIPVSNVDELKAALTSARGGDLIELAPGTYKWKQSKIPVVRIDSETLYPRPVIVRSQPGYRAVIELDTVEGFVIGSPTWTFANLSIRGAPPRNGKDRVEHAFHLAGQADDFHLVNSELINFNAAIKSNGLRQGTSEEVFPDRVKIVNNNLFNEWKRNTKSPVVFIDVVGGRDWEIRGNFIADFSKSGQGGGGITYGAYLKGNGTGGVMADNLVACAWRVPTTSSKDIRIGLSLGGGGTGDGLCEGGSCPQEYTDGTLLRNTILNCELDVGVYLNRAKGSYLEQNKVLGSLGITARFPETSALLVDNDIEGRIKVRDGGSLIER